MSDPLGTDVHLAGDFVLSPTGDLQLVSGTDHLKQRIVHRVMTLPQDYFFGEFGSTVKPFVDAVDAVITDKIKQAVSAAIMTEPDVAQILSLDVTQSLNTIEIDATIQAINGQSLQVQTSVVGGV